MRQIKLILTNLHQMGTSCWNINSRAKIFSITKFQTTFRCPTLRSDFSQPRLNTSQMLMTKKMSRMIRIVIARLWIVLKKMRRGIVRQWSRVRTCQTSHWRCHGLTRAQLALFSKTLASLVVQAVMVIKKLALHPHQTITIMAIRLVRKASYKIYRKRRTLSTQVAQQGGSMTILMLL